MRCTSDSTGTSPAQKLSAVREKEILKATRLAADVRLKGLKGEVVAPSIPFLSIKLMTLAGLLSFIVIYLAICLLCPSETLPSAFFLALTYLSGAMAAVAWVLICMEIMLDDFVCGMVVMFCPLLLSRLVGSLPRRAALPRLVLMGSLTLLVVFAMAHQIVVPV